MKVIDYSTQEKSAGKPTPLARAFSRVSANWSHDEGDAEEVIVSSLNRVLDTRYFLLRNVTLEGPNIPISLILVGPPGVVVICASGTKGVFRANEDVWEELDERAQDFKPARSNLLTRTQLMGRAVDTFLSRHDNPVAEVDAILFFSNPGVHIDTNRPIVRIVLADAVDRFAASLTQSPALLDARQVQAVVDLLGGDEPVVTDAQRDERDIFSFQDEQKREKRKLKVPELALPQEPAVAKKFSFSRRQWVLLAALLIINILLLVALVIFVLMAA